MALTGSGYSPPKEGPFLCGHCRHFTPPAKDGTTCDKPEVRADPKANYGKIAFAGCCYYYKPLELAYRGLVPK